MVSITLREVFKSDLSTHAYKRDVDGLRLIRTRCGDDVTKDKLTAWECEVTCTKCLDVRAAFDPVAWQAAEIAAHPLRVVRAKGTPAVRATAGAPTRENVLDALAATGYVGPTSYTKTRLLEMLAERTET